MCVYIHLYIHICMSTVNSMEKWIPSVMGNVTSQPRCPGLFFSYVHLSQLQHALLLRLTCDVEKIALGTGVKLFLRELEILGSYMFPEGFCSGLSKKPYLQADRLPRHNLHSRASWERKWSLGFPLKLYPCLGTSPFLSISLISLLLSPRSKSLRNHLDVNCPVWLWLLQWDK